SVGSPSVVECVTVTAGMVDSRRRTPARIFGLPPAQFSASVLFVHSELLISSVRTLPTGSFRGVLMPFSRRILFLAFAPAAQIFFRTARLPKKSLGVALTIRTRAVARLPVAA